MGEGHRIPYFSTGHSSTQRKGDRVTSDPKKFFTKGVLPVSLLKKEKRSKKVLRGQALEKKEEGGTGRHDGGRAIGNGHATHKTARVFQQFE